MSIADGVVGGMTQVVNHGPATQRWNLVILGDGYRAAELGKYRTDVLAFVKYLYGTFPFYQLWQAINIYMVEVSSTDSGADDPGACADGSLGTGVAAATYFDSTFCFGGTTRRLLAGNEATALAVSQAQVPQVHLTLVIVNTPTYSGADVELIVIQNEPNRGLRGASQSCVHNESGSWSACPLPSSVVRSVP
jgi:hypothetical protein